MRTAAKVAVSIPVDTLKLLERTRKQLGKSRSAAVTLAIQEWLRSQQLGDDDRRYAEAYLRHPERVDETAAVAAAAASSWQRWR